MSTGSSRQQRAGLCVGNCSDCPAETLAASSPTSSSRTRPRPHLTSRIAQSRRSPASTPRAPPRPPPPTPATPPPSPPPPPPPAPLPPPPSPPPPPPAPPPPPPTT